MIKPIILDYTTRIAPDILRAVGAVGVTRYLSYLPRSEWKVIKKPEYNELIKAGLIVTLNWEYRATDWMEGNAIQDATEAVRQAKALGYPAGEIILGSADFDMSRGTWEHVGHKYAADFARVIRAGGYRPGVYGPYDVLQWVRDAGLMDVFWQAGMSTAWSNGRNANAWPGAHIRQRGHMKVGTIDTDWNEILILPLWGSTTGDTMPLNDADLKAIQIVVHREVWAFKGTKPIDAWQTLNTMADTVKAIATKVDIDPTELAAITEAARAGAEQAMEGVADAILTKLPADTLTRQDVIQAIHDAFRWDPTTA